MIIDNQSHLVFGPLQQNGDIMGGWCSACGMANKAGLHCVDSKFNLHFSVPQRINHFSLFPSSIMEPILQHFTQVFFCSLLIHVPSGCTFLVCQFFHKWFWWAETFGCSSFGPVRNRSYKYVCDGLAEQIRTNPSIKVSLILSNHINWFFLWWWWWRGNNDRGG